MWLISGSESRSTCPRCICLCQNYPGFYQHCEDSMSKTLKEIELGLIDGPYPGLLFIPQRSDANSVVVKNGKARQVVDGSMKAVDHIMTPAGPIDLSINAGQDLDLDQHIFAPKLPTVRSFGIILGVLATLMQVTADLVFPPVEEKLPVPETFSSYATDTGFTFYDAKAFAPAVAVLDFERFFRQVRIRRSDWWMACATTMTGGCTLDLANQFGLRATPGTCCRVSDWILLITVIRVTAILSKWSRWTPGAKFNGHVPGCWDTFYPVWSWRQTRYDAAIGQGLNHEEALGQTIPLCGRCYVDDVFAPVAAFLVLLFVKVLTDICAEMNFLLSLPKTQIAFTNGTLYGMDAKNELVFKGKEPAVALGKEVRLDAQQLGDTPARLEQVINLWTDLKQQIGTSKAKTPLVLLESVRVIVGVLIFVASTDPAVFALLQWPMMSLRVKQTRSTWGHYKRTFIGGETEVTPWSVKASEAMQLIIARMTRREGMAFMPYQDPPPRDQRIQIVSDAAGNADDDMVSYRGGAAAIITSDRPFSQGFMHQWTEEDLRQHSTSLEIATAIMAIQAVIALQQAGTLPPFDIIVTLDNAAAVASMRRNGVHSASLKPLIAQWVQTQLRLPVSRRVFIFWSSREAVVSIADALSKGSPADADELLQRRGLPLLAERFVGAQELPSFSQIDP